LPFYSAKIHPRDCGRHLLDHESSTLGLRVFLITFAIGLFLVSIYARLSEYAETVIIDVKVEDVPVDLPLIGSDSPLIIRPETEKFFCGGGGYCTTIA
jgi:hypothetical protein